MNYHITWITNGTILTPRGPVRGAVGFRESHIVDVRAKAPKAGTRFDAKGGTIAPGFIDLHVWGEPAQVARQEIKHGTTRFLTAIGPDSPESLINRLVRLERLPNAEGAARCLGVHLEGPFLNPLRAGALASRWLRPPSSQELRQVVQHAEGRLKLVTIAPELPRGIEAIRWLARHRVVVSLGHSDASAEVAQRAVHAGATAITHAFNGMRPLHHRDPGLLGEVLTDDRLMAMVILDGVHVSPVAFQLLLRCKGPHGIALATDSVRHQSNHRAKIRGGAFYIKPGVLAGSRLTMIDAVRNAVRFGKLPVAEAVRMASANPARLLGMGRTLGSIEPGQQADLVVFDRRFRISMVMVAGTLAYRRTR